MRRGPQEDDHEDQSKVTNSHLPACAREALRRVDGEATPEAHSRSLNQSRYFAHADGKPGDRRVELPIWFQLLAVPFVEYRSRRVERGNQLAVVAPSRRMPTGLSAMQAVDLGDDLLPSMVSVDRPRRPRLASATPPDTMERPSALAAFSAVVFRPPAQVLSDTNSGRLELLGTRWRAATRCATCSNDSMMRWRC